MILQKDFNIDDHFICFEKFKLYKHNVLGHNALDINGKYILKSVKDTTGSVESSSVYSENDKDVEVIFKFEHENNSNLTFWYTIKYHGKQSGINLVDKNGILKHSGYNTLVKMTYDPKKKYSKYVVHQYLYNEYEEIELKIEAVSKYSYWKGEIITVILTGMTIWQYIHDLLFYIHFWNLPNTKVTIDYACGSYPGAPCTTSTSYPDYGVNHWTRYECAGYILSNSGTFKNYVIFILCWRLFGQSFMTRKYTAAGLVFLGLMTLHCTLMIPFIITHYFLFGLLFIWILCGSGCLIMCFGAGSTFLKDDTYVIRIIGGLASVIVMILIPTMYIIFILFPVISMSRLYAGDGYLYSISSVFNDRNTIDAVNNEINGWRNNYFAIQQLFVWLF